MSEGSSGGFFEETPDWFLPGLGAVGGVLDGLLGGKGNRLAMDLLGKGLGTVDYGLEQIPGMRDRTLGEIDAANIILDGIEPAVLEGIDESGRIRIAQQIRQSQQDREAQQQRMATAGLDSTTVAPAMDRSFDYGRAQQVANVSAQYAGMRSGAIAQARGMAAQGRMARAGATERYHDRSLGLLSQKANMYYGTQVAPDDGAFGSIAASIGDGIHTNALLDYLRNKKD